MEAQPRPARAPAPAPDDLDILKLIRYARRALHAAGAAFDEAQEALQARGYCELQPATDMQALESHLLHYRCTLLYQMAEHAITGKPIPSYEPLTGWLH